MHLRLVFHAHAQGSGGILELLVDDETFDQDVTRLLWRQVRELVIEFDLLDAVLGKKRGCLDLQQSCRHDEKIARDIEVEILHALDFRKVLVGDVRNRNGADIDLLA